jgi:uncharacterized repeat protein (TIGR01451 family)
LVRRGALHLKARESVRRDALHLKTRDTPEGDAVHTGAITPDDTLRVIPSTCSPIDFSGWRHEMKTHWSAAGLIALLAFATLASAQPAGPVQTRLEASKVERAADGSERLVPAQAARPGDVIEYTATYRNTGEQPVRDLDATLPIPSDTEFVAGSDKPAGAMASLDGRAFAAMPLKRRVTRGGKTVEEDVPLREYRYLRWRVARLGGGKSVSFDARVKVLEDEKSQGRGTPRTGQ